MRTHLLPCLILLLPCAESRAQNQLAVERIQHPWPAGSSGAFTDLTVLRPHAGHLGLEAVSLRGGVLYRSFQPQSFEHFVATPIADVVAIGTVDRAESADSLVTVGPGGLRIFDADPATGSLVLTESLPSWSNCHDVHVARFVDGNTERHGLLGLQTNRIWMAMLDPVLGLIDSGSAAVPNLRSAASVDWDGTGLPEIAIATAAGVIVIDPWLNVQLNVALPMLDAHIAPHPSGGFVLAHRHIAVSSSGDEAWGVTRFQPGTSPSSFGSIPLGYVPNGIVAADFTGDGEVDLIVSTTASATLLAEGDPSGIDVTSATLLSNVDHPLPGTTATAVAVADLDLDGRLDCVALDQPTASLAVIPDLRQAFINLQGASFQNGDATLEILQNADSPIYDDDEELQIQLDLQGLGPILAVQIVAWQHPDPAVTGAVEVDSIAVMNDVWLIPEDASVVQIEQPIPASMQTLLDEPFWPGGEHFVLELRSISYDETTNELLTGAAVAVYGFAVQDQPGGGSPLGGDGVKGVKSTKTHRIIGGIKKPYTGHKISGGTPLIPTPNLKGAATKIPPGGGG